MFKPFLRVQAAPGHDGIGGADGCGIQESVVQAVFIIILQEGTVNVVADVLFMRQPVIVHKLGGNILQKI